MLEMAGGEHHMLLPTLYFCAVPNRHTIEESDLTAEGTAFDPVHLTDLNIAHASYFISG